MGGALKQADKYECISSILLFDNALKISFDYTEVKRASYSCINLEFESELDN